MKEIKDRMEILEKTQAHDSKHLEGLHSGLNQLKQNYTREKTNYQKLSKKKPMKRYLVIWKE